MKIRSVTVDNFYYEQEDGLSTPRAIRLRLERASPAYDIGFAIGNAMNMGVTLAVYARFANRRANLSCFPVLQRNGTV